MTEILFSFYVKNTLPAFFVKLSQRTLQAARHGYDEAAFYYTMKKEHNYVGCPWCSPEAPRANCSQCKGTGKVVDPAEQLCNMCGEWMCHKIKLETGTWNADVPHGLYEANVVGGYESYHLFDMTSYTFSFCEECLRKLFIQCKIKPTVANLNFGSNPSGLPFLEEGEETQWSEDMKSYEFRIWKDNGGHHQAYLNRKCNAIKDCPNKAAYTLLHNHTDFTEDALCEEHQDHKYLNSTLTKFIPNVLKAFL